MWPSETRTLPEWLEDGYEILVSATEAADQWLSHEQARAALLDHDSFPDEPGDAEYALKRLLETGYLYEVKDELRVTDMKL